ncbi:RNA binding effector protein [Apiospora rasikravindrae]|uniref:RNA binding effector protein n=1 Tax=Apiospora rasikravindrae TaxID=990691 RepID=A0ABR1T0J5_9PEZI
MVEQYQVPQKTSYELAPFQQGLQETYKYILDLGGKQEQLKVETLGFQTRFHTMIRKYIKKKQSATVRTAGDILVCGRRL